MNALSRPISSSDQSPSTSQWELLDVMEDNERRAGGAPQHRAVLQNQELGGGVQVRIKRATRANEVKQNLQIFERKDPLSKYLPKFYGAYFKPGAWLSPQDIRQLQWSQQGIFYVMEDFTTSLAPGEEIDDFKFSSPLNSSRGIEELRKKHHITPRSTLRLKLQDWFFKKCAFENSFILSPTRIRTGCKLLNSFILRIKQIISMIFSTTERRLKHHFKRLEKEELRAAIRSLEEMKKAIRTSDFAFADASLLFIPTRQSDGTSGLEIRLVDMAYCVSKDENFPLFTQMQEAAAQSIDKLISLATSILQSSPKNFTS